MASFKEINIPQKPPMVMVDKLCRVEERIIETTFQITNENVFCDKGIFNEAGLVENMAQTAAAGIGSRTVLTGKTPPIGVIGGIRNLKVLRFPVSGNQLTTRITIEHEVFDASVVKGEVFLEGEMIATCQLKIFLQKDPG